MSVVTTKQGDMVIKRDLHCDAGRFASARCVGAIALPLESDDGGELPSGWAVRYDPFGRRNRHNGKRLKLHLCGQCVLATMPVEEPRIASRSESGALV